MTIPSCFFAWQRRLGRALVLAALLGCASLLPSDAVASGAPDDSPSQRPASDTLSTHELSPGLVLHFVSSPLDPEMHEVAENFEGIDGCLVYGTDGSQPDYALKEAYVTLRRQRLDIDASCLYQNWPFDARNVSAEPLGGDAYRLHGRFSDGVGTFEATWLVMPTGTARTHLQDGLELMQERQRQRDCFLHLSESIERLAMLLIGWQEQQSVPGADVNPHALESALELLDEIERISSDPSCSP